MRETRGMVDLSLIGHVIRRARLSAKHSTNPDNCLVYVEHDVVLRLAELAKKGLMAAEDAEYRDAVIPHICEVLGITERPEGAEGVGNAIIRAIEELKGKEEACSTPS